MRWREFWFVRGKVKKFWKIRLDGTSYTVCAGRKGTDGKTTTKKFRTATEAEGAYHTAISVAAGKCYREGKEAPPSIAHAIEEGDLEAFRKFLKKNPSWAKEATDDGETLLHYAVQAARCDMARLLLEAGADVNAVGGEDQVTPFGMVVRDFASNIPSDVAMIELMLPYKPDLNIVDSYGHTLAYYIALDEELAELVAEYDVTPTTDPVPTLLNTLRTHGLARVQQQLEAHPEHLREPGIGDILGDAITGMGDKALTFATYLLDHGVSPNVLVHNQPLLEWAVHQGRAPKIVRLLLERGADVKALPHGGRTLLLSAIYVRTAKEIIADLIRFGVKKDLIVQLEMDGPKAVLAALKRKPALLQELDDPVELLSRAIAHHELVATLLNLGVDPNAHTPGQFAPLRLAVRRADVKLVRLLLAHGANPNPNDAHAPYGVLYEGMQEEHAERLQTIIAMLLAAGAKPNPDTHDTWMKQLDAMVTRRARAKKRKK